MVNGELYPMFCNLSGKRVAVVGAGQVALRKIQALLNTKAVIHVISPDALHEIATLDQAGAITWHRRAYHYGDLTGFSIVFAATNDKDVNRLIADEGKQAGIWVNAASESLQGNFFVPAVVKRGPLQIAISTSGVGPAVAKQIREQLEDKYGDAYLTYLDMLGDLRTQLQREVDDPAHRKAIIKWFVSSDLLNLICEGIDHEQILDWIQQQLIVLKNRFDKGGGSCS